MNLDNTLDGTTVPDPIDSPEQDITTLPSLIRPPSPLPLPTPIPLPLPTPMPGPVVTSPCEPVINAINPTQGMVLASLAIIGSGFKPTSTQCMPGDSGISVAFADSHPGGAITAQVLSATDTQIMVTVPNGAKTSQITVRNTKGFFDTSDASFTVLPTINDIVPLRGGVGTPVTVFGTALYNTPQFYFSNADGDIPAPYTVPASNVLDRIVIGVPAGVVPGKSYKIKVVTKGGGIARSASDFVVSAATPQVGDYSPKQGPVGTEVTVTALPGTRFERITSVSFLTNPDAVGRARRIFLKPGEFRVSGNMASIKVRVPDGAVTGKIRISNDSGAGTTGKFRVPLATPAALAGRVNVNQGVDLSWRDTTTTEVGFRLERAFGANGGELDFQLLTTLPKDSNAWTDATAPLNQPVRYRLKSFNTTDGESAPSNLVVATSGGALQLNPIRLQFAGQRDGANPAAQNLLIERGPTRNAEQVWTARSDATWLSVRPVNGSTPAMAAVSVDLFGLSSGRYTGVISVGTPSGDSVISATVELVVSPPAGAITVQIVSPEDGV